MTVRVCHEEARRGVDAAAAMARPGAALDPAPGDAAAVPDVGGLLDRLEHQARTDPRFFLDRTAAELVDVIAVRCARGRGALDLEIGELLHDLRRTGGEVTLGFSHIADLARERLGLPADFARRLARDAGKLRSRPLLRSAVLAGEVTLRKAEIVLDRAKGAEEAYCVERAKVDTVRRLQGMVRSGPGSEEEDWHRIRLGLQPDEAKVVQVALDSAGILLGPTAPLWRRIEAISMEFLATHPVEPRGKLAWGLAAISPSVASPSSPATDVACGFQRPAAGVVDGRSGGLATGDAPSPEPVDPFEIMARLVRLARERARLDEHLGRAGLLLKRFGLWGTLGYGTFDHYCAEHLGLAPSTVRQRVALEGRLSELPPLREALRSGRLSYEQARLVARVATPADVDSRIEAAAASTCIAYRRALDQEEERQMWRAGELRAVVPEEVDSLLADAIRAARAHFRQVLTPGQALVAIAVHFVQTWGPEVRRLLGVADEVILRDEGLCQVPGCSLPAAHVHHIRFRSANGSEETWNKVSLCAVHHLLGVHMGNIHVSGRAPGELVWILGRREVAAARAEARAASARRREG